MPSSHYSSVLLSHDQIKARIQELTKEMEKEYQGKQVLLVGVLKGAYMFLAHLTEELWSAGLQDFEVDFFTISSYHGTTRSKNPKIVMDLDTDIEGRHVLIIEDIVDSGHSLDTMMRIFQSRKPASIKVCALLSKPSKRAVEVPIDYLGFEIEDHWVEGFGMDTKQKYRGNPDIVYRQFN